MSDPDEQPLDLPDDPDPAIPVAEPVPVPDPVRCWRCERVEVPEAGRCPKCGARVAEVHQRRRSRAAAQGEANPLKTMLVVYAVMLGLSVVWGWILLAGGPRVTADELTVGTVVLGTLDALLVVVGISLVGWTPLPPRTGSTRAKTWLVSWPVLAVLLVLNVLYFALLREYINAPRGAGAAKLDLATILLVCVQPAIVEELFFRYLALGVLFRVTGVGTAVLVSAVMFAMIHIYNPLGIPYLFLVGVALGYARVYGGLALPMVLHFVHNFAVTAIEVAK